MLTSRCTDTHDATNSPQGLPPFDSDEEKKLKTIKELSQEANIAVRIDEEFSIFKLAYDSDEEKKLKIIKEYSKEANVAARIDEEFSILMLAISEIIASLFDGDDDEVYAICNFIGAISGLVGAAGYLYWLRQNKLQNKELSKWQEWILNKLSLQKNEIPSMFHGYKLSFVMPATPKLSQEKTLYLKMKSDGLHYLLCNPEKPQLIFQGIIKKQDLGHHTLADPLNEDELRDWLPKIYMIIADHHLSGKGRPTQKENPWARIWKTCYVFGKNLGDLIGRFIPLPFVSHINLTGKILGFVLGIICGVGGLLFFKEELTESQHSYLKLGRDGWTKYGKTGLVYGGSVGGIIGGFLGLSLGPAGIIAGVTLGSLIGSLIGFVVSVAIVPIFNRLKLKIFPNAKSSFRLNLDTYRTNYIRAGLSLGACIGAFIGGLLGTVFLPGLGTMGGMALGGAIGGAVGGLIWGVVGPQVAHHLENPNSGNTYDYAVRASIMFGDKTGLGGALKKVPVIGNFVASFCGAVAGVIGGIYEICNASKLREIKKEGDREKKEQGYILPWTQWVPTGIVVGSAIGGFIGIFAGGPIGMLIGSGIGGLIGGVLACYAEPFLRKFGLIPTVALVVPVSGEQPPPPDSPRPSSQAQIFNVIAPPSDASNLNLNSDLNPNPEPTISDQPANQNLNSSTSSESEQRTSPTSPSQSPTIERIDPELNNYSMRLRFSN